MPWVGPYSFRGAKIGEMGEVSEHPGSNREVARDMYRLASG